MFLSKDALHILYRYNKAYMIKQDRINQIFVSNGNHCPCDFKGNMLTTKGEQ